MPKTTKQYGNRKVEVVDAQSAQLEFSTGTKVVMRANETKRSFSSLQHKALTTAVNSLKQTRITQRLDPS